MRGSLAGAGARPDGAERRGRTAGPGSDTRSDLAAGVGAGLYRRD